MRRKVLVGKRFFSANGPPRDPLEAFLVFGTFCNLYRPLIWVFIIILEEVTIDVA